MHGAGQWVGFLTWHTGGTIYLQRDPERLDPADIWSVVEHERVTFLAVVGDAFARPLLDELERHALRPVVADGAAVGRGAAGRAAEGGAAAAPARRS